MCNVSYRPLERRNRSPLSRQRASPRCHGRTGHSVSPEFSEQAKQDKVGGIVLVHLWGHDLDKLEHVRVLREVGNGLDEKAVAAVKQHKFNPAMEAEK